MAEIKFEEALKKLEKLVNALERGELSLDDSLKKYEEGVRLAKICTKKLEEAERKVEILVKSEGGQKAKKSFDISKGEDKKVNGGEGKGGDKDEELLF